MTGKDDGGVEGFLEKTFQNEDNRLVMESRYPDVVLMAYIMKGDMDRAQYYLSLSLQAFQQVELHNKLLFIGIVLGIDVCWPRKGLGGNPTPRCLLFCKPVGECLTMLCL